MFQDSVPARSYNDPFLSSVCACLISFKSKSRLCLRLIPVVNIGSDFGCGIGFDLFFSNRQRTGVF